VRRPLLHALTLHGIAHGYGVELDRVKVAKAEAFCKGVIDELALRGVLTNSSSANKDSCAVGAAAKAAAGAGGEVQEAGSQGSDVSNVSDATQVLVDCASQTGPPEPAAAAAASSKKADQAAGAEKAARSPPAAAAAAAVSGKKAGAKLKGEALLWPASRPIITCAAVEQVSCLLFRISVSVDCIWEAALAVSWCVCVCVPTHACGGLAAGPTHAHLSEQACAAPRCDMTYHAVPCCVLCCADADCQPGPRHACLLILGGCASQRQAGLWAAVQDEQDNEGVCAAQIGLTGFLLGTTKVLHGLCAGCRSSRRTIV
jgi:hypothetical protein